MTIRAILKHVVRQPSREPMRTIITIAIGVGLFGTGYALGSLSPARTAHAQTGTPTDVETLFAPFWETWQLLRANYVDQPLDENALMEGALRGMVDSLDDRHTAYLTPEEYTLQDSDLSGQFEGIGAEVELNEKGEFVIVAPMDDTPAEAAGLLSGDQIVAVDGVDVHELGESQIISQVRGPAGTLVVLTIRRNGVPGTFDVEVARALITIQDVEWEIVDGDIAYVRLAQFSSTASDNLETGLREALALQPAGLVLDLRGNPGGLLDAAIDITGEFIGDGPLMIERWGDGSERIYEASGDGLATSIPLIVLVDNGSASASEVLALAVQNRGRGTILGETSFGKGTIQNWHQLVNGGGLRLTNARWVAPDGTSIHETGVEPDVTVRWSGARPPQTEDDVQVKAAIEVLRGEQLWATWPLPWVDAVSANLTG